MVPRNFEGQKITWYLARSSSGKLDRLRECSTERLGVVRHSTKCNERLSVGRRILVKENRDSTGIRDHSPPPRQTEKHRQRFLTPFADSLVGQVMEALNQRLQSLTGPTSSQSAIQRKSNASANSTTQKETKRTVKKAKPSTPKPLKSKAPKSRK